MFNKPFDTIVKTLFKWATICVLVGLLVGTASALFLYSLDWVTQFREHHIWMICFLPIAGLFIGLGYQYYGAETSKGNNLLLQAHQGETNRIPWTMTPTIWISTLLTHIAGGSAGREGTAVQMGGAIADQFTRFFDLIASERNTLLIIGISAGFAAVFGTPIAGAVFAMEIMLFKNIKAFDILPSFVTAFIAHYSCLGWGIHHTQYVIMQVPAISVDSVTWSMLAGVLFGLAAYLFSLCNTWWSFLFQKIKNKLLLIVGGGIVIAFVVFAIGNTKFIGLGIPTIQAAFESPTGYYDFLIKILLTTFTLSVGFKGGEVTPLFFIGATLGNILILFIPLPMGLLAGMGFVAVFAGATHCSIASILLGIELFGWQAGVFVGIASVLAYFSSGSIGIYSAQINQGAKYRLYQYVQRITKL
jgi:H+/Cl- antiporter ClcA